ncbi:hypothetical protein AWC38_SpisGene17206 [Stylophora pistillata]|uniref:Ubiquitin-like domain-containing protein n=1 Tax=Stylophora pistillata TaxID=50429 RepID=A0A2B4RQ84_STYPI|nr:hypothetical protein AWC38_SpisGene17206 [Stylophora pistillata]
MVANKTLCKGEIVPDGGKDSPLHPTENLSLLSNCYSKAGYSVLVSDGSLCEITSEMGLVEMENGTAFQIAVQNNNDYAVEVDVTFSGRFLGFWTVDARQSYPLIIEGSAWENGKLTFISEPSETEHGVLSEPNGKLELEFKPEAMVLFVRHLGTEKRHEVLLTDFKLATVSDLRDEINQTLWDQLGCITCLIKDGEVLDELQFIRSYFLKNGDIIEVLTSEEPILIKSCHMDPFTLWVDPRYDSIESVRETVATKMNVDITRGNLSLLLDGEHIEERRGLLTKVFLQSRKPVLKAIVACNFINITVHLPSKEAKRVRISCFATVDELKRCLNIPTSGTLLKVGDREIQEGSGLKELYDLGIRDESEVMVTFPTESRASSCGDPSHESIPEELAENESHSPSSHILGRSSEFNPFPEDMYGISGHFNNMEWIGEDESFCGCYQLDNRKRRFTKNRLKSVTLVVQLCSRRRELSGYCPST